MGKSKLHVQIDRCNLKFDAGEFDTQTLLLCKAVRSSSNPLVAQRRAFYSMILLLLVASDFNNVTRGRKHGTHLNKHSTCMISGKVVV